MRIERLEKDLLMDFQDLYVEFFKELRKKQGWDPHDEAQYRMEASHYFERGDLIFIAIEDERAVGFIRVSSREGSYWVEEVYVEPDFRKRGIGRALVEAAEREVEKHDPALYLFVLPQDKDAIAFWKKLGYGTVNTVELVKELERTRRGESERRVIEILGEVFEIFSWKTEDFTDEEKDFMELLKEFHENGGTKEEFLKLVIVTLSDWLEKNKAEAP